MGEVNVYQFILVKQIYISIKYHEIVVDVSLGGDS